MGNKYKISEFKVIMHETFDLYICSSSFEERCLSISRNIDISKIRNTLIIYNSEYLEHLQENKAVLESIFKDKATCVEVKMSEPIFSADNIKKSMKDLSKASKIDSILLDITTFTHETLLILLRLLQIMCSDAEITCVYANASEYDSENKETDKWLSKGIGEIRSVLGYPGDILPTRKTHLIVIVGYEFERATSIINSLEPSSLALGFGRSDNATTDKDKGANEHFLQLVEQMAASYANITRFEIKCDNPFETAEELNGQIKGITDRNILIVPLNNKLSTLGVAFAAMENENVQLCYAPALSYNHMSYSSIGDSFYVFPISQMLKSTKGRLQV